MIDSYTREIIGKLYKNANFRQIIDLFSFVIKIEKNLNVPVINRIFTSEYLLLSLNAVYWNINNPENYYKISSSIKISSNNINDFNIKEIRKLLVKNIYEEVIKKEIMMI
ncbi:MAG: hypothetical protein LUH05_00845 [Candidatus Gastranaerophilales bacterium]|nr:hypothetical protein [Candidatus Gastranaerophilales bacterium]